MDTQVTLPEQPPGLFPEIHLGRWKYVPVGFFALVLVAVFAFVIFRPIQVLPRIRLAPGYALRDQEGRTLTSEDLRGHFVLYNFTHTACRAPACPQYDLIMREVQRRLGEVDTGGTPITLVTIVFDTEHADPETLRAYAAELDADLDGWYFVSGDADTLKRVVGGGFQVYYQRDAVGSYTFSPAMVLVDGWGVVRAIYSTRTYLPETDRILRHFSVLAQEVQNSKGVARLGYEAAHLFLCYAS